MLGTMEYAVKHRRHPNTVQRALRENRIPGAVKDGGKWSIPDDAIIGGEPTSIPTVQLTAVPTDQPTAQPTEQDTELSGLDKELADMDKEEAKVDRLTAIAEKRLRLKSDIGWDAYQDRLKEMRKAEAKLLADRAQLKDDRVDLSKRDSGLDDVERSLRGSLDVMSGWWNDARVLILDIVEAVQAIQHEATYDKSNPQAYLSQGTGFGGDRPPGKTLLIGKALNDRWYEIFKVLVEIARLPKPDFRIDIHRSDVKLLDAGDLQETDGQEPEEVDAEDVIEDVGKAVDEEVKKELPDVEEPEIVPKKRSKKQGKD